MLVLHGINGLITITNLYTIYILPVALKIKNTFTRYALHDKHVDYFDELYSAFYVNRKPTAVSWHNWLAKYTQRH